MTCDLLKVLTYRRTNVC